MTDELIAELRGFAEQHKVGSIRVDMDDLRALLAALDQRDAEVERLREGLAQFTTCMCGDAVDAHGYFSGHSPVSVAGYYYNTERERAEAAEARAQAAEQRLKAVTEALEPFSKLAAETLTPGSPDYQEWLSEAKDWMVIFAFAGRSVTLGDLRRIAALAAAQAPAGENSDEQ